MTMGNFTGGKGERQNTKWIFVFVHNDMTDDGNLEREERESKSNEHVDIIK